MSLRERVRRLSFEWLVSLLLFALAFGYAAAAAGFFASMNAPLHFDDGYVAALAARMIHGRFLPYVDGASHRGAVFYWLAGIAQWLGGWSEWHGLRVLALVVFLLSTCGVFAAAVAARRVLAGASAALLFVFINVCLFETETAFGMVGEPTATTFVILSVAVLAVALCRTHTPRGQLALLALSGGLAALAGLAKQTYLLVVLPNVLWCASVALEHGEGPLVRRLRPVYALVAGCAIPPVIVLTIYAVAGELKTFFYWFYSYNRIYMAPYGVGRAEHEFRTWVQSNGYLALAIVVVLTASALRILPSLLRGRRSLAARYGEVGFEATVLLQALIALLASVAPLRFWTQYYVPPAAWLALLIGLGFEALCAGTSSQSPGEGQRLRRAGSALLAGALGIFTVPLMNARVARWHYERAQGGWGPARPERLCEAIDRFARPGEPIFLWGFDGDVYITCRHPPASRYVYSTLVAGIVPPFWDKPNPRYVAAGSQRTLLHELERARPPVILDYPGKMLSFSIRRIGALANYLDHHYCSVADARSNNGRTMKMWVRRDRCPAK